MINWPKREISPHSSFDRVAISAAFNFAHSTLTPLTSAKPSPSRTPSRHSAHRCGARHAEGLSRSFRPWARFMTATFPWCAWRGRGDGSSSRSSSTRPSSRRMKISAPIHANSTPTLRRSPKRSVDLVWAPTASDVSGRFRHPHRPGRAGQGRARDKFRPHFFGGVATVVAKLLANASPTWRCSARRTTSSSR